MTRITEFDGVNGTCRFAKLDATRRFGEWQQTLQFDERGGTLQFANWGCIYTQIRSKKRWLPSRNRVDISVKFNYYLSN